MKNIIAIALICGLVKFAFSQNFGIDQPNPLVKLHVNGNAFFDLPSGGAALENSLTIKKSGQGQIGFGSYPGAWTPALQIQNNDNTKYIWLSPLSASGNARLVSIGSDFDIMPGNSLAATFYSSGSAYIPGNLTLGSYGGMNSTPTSYGSIALNIARNGYYGVLFGQSTSNPNIMYDGSGNGGIYYQNYGWLSYYLVGSRHLNINTSSDMGATLGVNGTLYANANIYNTVPSQGNLGLTGDLPGYSVNTYPTLKTSGSYLYFSLGNTYTAYIDPGGGYHAVSSRIKKENFEVLNKQEVLHKISELEMYKWNYKMEDASVKHIGPIAEDFWDKFHLGGDDCMISHIDPAGVALVGVQALNENYQSQQKQIESIQSNLSDFGSVNVLTKELWVNFNSSFSNSIEKNQLPTVTVTSNQPNVNMYVAAKTNKGFKLVVSSPLPEGLTVDYIAMAHAQKTAPLKQPAKSTVCNNIIPYHSHMMKAFADPEAPRTAPAAKISAPVNMELSPEQMNKFKMETEARKKIGTPALQRNNPEDQNH